MVVSGSLARDEEVEDVVVLEKKKRRKSMLCFVELSAALLDCCDVMDGSISCSRRVLSANRDRCSRLCP